MLFATARQISCSFCIEQVPMQIVEQLSNHLRPCSRPHEQQNKELCNTHISENSQMTHNTFIEWIQACVLFANIFIGIEDISFIEQIP